MKAVVDATKGETGKPVIYDHQKAGTDIPEETPQKFMDAMVISGINAIILMPQAGPITEYEWIKAAQERNLGVIVGGEMTHPRYKEGDLRNLGDKNYTEIFRNLGIDRTITGFIRQHTPEDMYEIAARMGVKNFVVPGNKPDKIREYRKLIKNCGISGESYWSPGLVAQGGEISEGGKAAGERFHAIVGRGIYQKKVDGKPVTKTLAEMKESALELAADL